jgi:hypothetical protein
MKKRRMQRCALWLLAWACSCWLGLSEASAQRAGSDTKGAKRSGKNAVRMAPQPKSGKQAASGTPKRAKPKRGGSPDGGSALPSKRAAKRDGAHAGSHAAHPKAPASKRGGAHEGSGALSPKVPAPAKGGAHGGSHAMSPSVPGPARGGAHAGSHAITPKVPAPDYRKRRDRHFQDHRRLAQVPVGRAHDEALPKRPPIAYRQQTEQDLRRRQGEVARYSGGLRRPTSPHGGRIERQHSRMLLNYSGKLSIAKPANDRKSYYKLSRPTSTYLGDLRVRWLHYHHPHPSLWRMGRQRDRASSAEVWRNRRMPKRSKYDPGERKIWDQPRSTPAPSGN